MRWQGLFSKICVEGPAEISRDVSSLWDGGVDVTDCSVFTLGFNACQELIPPSVGDWSTLVIMF